MIIYYSAFILLHCNSLTIHCTVLCTTLHVSAVIATWQLYAVAYHPLLATVNS